MRPLFWAEEPASKPIIRATYFLQKGHGWLPYSEKDSDLLEVCVKDCRANVSQVHLVRAVVFSSPVWLTLRGMAARCMSGNK